MNKFEKLIKTTVQKNLGGKTKRIQQIKGGKVGKIFVVTIPIGDINQDVIFKLIHKSRYKKIKDTESIDRIYGVNMLNFHPAYNLLKANNFVVPKLLAETLPEDNFDWDYQIMEKLEGVSIREFLQEGEGDLTELYKISASEFAKLHKIVRQKDGWTEELSTNRTTWGEDFMSAMDKLLAQLQEKDKYVRSCANVVGRVVSELSQKWEEPHEFVLSNKDGFQGMAKQENNLWKFTGLLDIEDYKFIDQRMVLAGYELPFYYCDRHLPDEFLKEYSRTKAIPDSYFSLKRLFMLFYVFYWLGQEYNCVPDLDAVSAHRNVLAKLGIVN